MSSLREGIFLRSYANVNPLQDYVNEGYSMFRDTLNLSAVDAVLNLINVKIEKKEQPKEEENKNEESQAKDAEVKDNK